MSMPIGEAFVEIGADASDFSTDLDRVLKAPLERAGAAAASALTRSFDKAKTSLNGVGSALASAGSSAMEKFSNGFKSVKGFGSTISQALQQGIDQASGTASGGGTELGNKFVLGFKQLVGGQVLANIATKAIGAVMNTVRSYSGEALTASDATDKFKNTLNFAGIDSSQIERLTAASQKYADETVYGLGDIQSITAQLAANSVPNFDKLAEAAGNLNAVAGGNAETFKGVGLALVQISGAGKLTTQDWNQLANAIPGASGKLQKAMEDAGAYTGNFREAMAKGEITAEEFNAALLELGMTDVAREAATATTTFEGAWGNFEAALVGGMSGVLTELKPFITDALGMATSAIEPVFTKLAGFAEKVTPKLQAGLKELSGGFTAFAAAWKANDGDITSSGFPGFMERLAFTGRAVFDEIRGAVISFGAAWKANDGDITSSGLPGLMERIAYIARQAFDAVTRLTSGFSGLGSVDLGGLAAVGGIVGAVMLKLAGPMTTLTSMATKFGAVMPGLASKVVGLGGTLSKLSGVFRLLTGPVGLIAGLLVTLYLTNEDVRNTFNSLFAVVGQFAGQLISMLMPILGQLVSTVLPVIASLVSSLMPILGTLVASILPLIVSLFESLAPILLNLLSGLLPPLIDVLGAVGAILTGVVFPILTQFIAFLGTLIPPVVNALLPVIQTVFNAISSVISAVMKVVQGVINVVLGVISGDWSRVWTGIKQVFGGIWDAIKGVVTGAINIVRSVIEGGVNLISGLWTSAWNGIKSFFSGLWDSIKSIASSAVDAVTGFVADIPGKIKAALSGLASLGENMMQGFIDGVKRVGSRIAETVLAPIRNAVQGVKNFLSIASPSKLMRGIGQFMGDGLIEGVDDMAPKTLPAILELVEPGIDQIKGVVEKPVGSVIPTGLTGTTAPATAAATGSVIHYSFGEGAFQIKADSLAAVKSIEDFERMLQVQLRMRGVPA